MKEIEKLRKKIDELDKKILDCLKERSKIVKEIGKLKSDLDLPVEDSSREEEVLKKCESGYERDVYLEILRASKKLQ